MERSKATKTRWGKWKDIPLDPGLEIGPAQPSGKKQQKQLNMDLDVVHQKAHRREGAHLQGWDKTPRGRTVPKQSGVKSVVGCSWSTRPWRHPPWIAESQICCVLRDCEVCAPYPGISVQGHSWPHVVEMLEEVRSTLGVLKELHTDNSTQFSFCSRGFFWQPEAAHLWSSLSLFKIVSTHYRFVLNVQFIIIMSKIRLITLPCGVPLSAPVTPAFTSLYKLYPQEILPYITFTTNTVYDDISFPLIMFNIQTDWRMCLN